jgi:hypothetical protein
MVVGVREASRADGKIQWLIQWFVMLRFADKLKRDGLLIGYPIVNDRAAFITCDA